MKSLIAILLWVLNVMGWGGITFDECMKRIYENARTPAVETSPAKPAQVAKPRPEPRPAAVKRA